MDTTNAKMMLGYMDDDDDEILDYDGNLDLSTDNEDEDEAESVQEYPVQHYPETPDEKIHWQEQIRMIHLRSHLNQLMEKVRHAHYVTDKTREELKKCRSQIQQYEAERDQLFAEIQNKETDGNKSAVHRVRAAHQRVCAELEGEQNLERMIIDRLDQAEYELALAEVERGKFLLAEDDLLQREHKLSQEKTDMAMVRLAKEETLARQALTHRRKEDRTRRDVQMNVERRHAQAIEEAERSHERANRYLQKTLDKLKQRENEEAERYKTDMSRKMDMLLKLKNDITHNRENLRAIRARDKAAERKENESELEEREIIKMQGGNPDEMLLVKKRRNEVEKQRSQFEAEQKVKKAAIMSKILQEEENLKKRKQQQPYLWDSPDRDKELRVKPLPLKPVKVLEDYMAATADEAMEVEDLKKEQEMLVKKVFTKQGSQRKRSKKHTKGLKTQIMDEAFSEVTEIYESVLSRPESESSVMYLNDKHYVGMLSKLSQDMQRDLQDDLISQELKLSVASENPPQKNKNKNQGDDNLLTEEEVTDINLETLDSAAIGDDEDLLDQSEMEAAEDAEDKVANEEMMDQVPLHKDSDESEEEEDFQAAVDLARPEFEGLWDKETKPYRIPKDTDHLSAKPVGGSKMDQEILKKTLGKTREGIVITQVAAGREFTGCPFYSKPDVIHFKDFVVGKTYKKKVSLTNVSYTVNYIKFIDITERLKDFVKIHFDPPGQMSAGLTCDMTVTFKPMINEDLEGEVNFLTQTGPFHVPLICSTKKCDLVLDTKCVDFGTTVIGETLRRSFTLTNRGALGTKFDFFKVTGMKQRTLTTAGTSLGRMSEDDSELELAGTTQENTTLLSKENTVPGSSVDLATKATRSSMAGAHYADVNKDNLRAASTASAVQHSEIKTTDSMRAVSPDSANDLDPSTKTKAAAGTAASSVAVDSKKKSEEALDKIPEAGETSVPPLDETGGDGTAGTGDETDGNVAETAPDDSAQKQEGDSEEAMSPDLAVSEMEEYTTLDGMRVGPLASGEIGPFSSLRLEIVWQPTLPGRVDPEFLVSFADPLSEPLSIRAVANAIDVPVWVERQTVDLKICMFDRLYQDTILVNNRATTALRLKFEVCKELRNHLELLPKTGYVQAQSQFSAQLKFLPRQSLFEEAAKYFDPETGVLEAPMTIRVADQTTPVHFTVQAVVTTSDLEFDVSDIDFGYCTIHESVKRTVRLTNHSILPQQFGFIGLPEYMEVQPNDGFGTLLPLETLELDVIFSPNKTREYKLDLVCRSLINRDFKISVRGVGVLTPLELTHQVIHFAATPLYDTASTVMHVVNSHTSSNEFTHPVPRIGKGEICPVGPTSFEFVVPKDSPVTVSPCVGTVEPGKTCRVQVRFSPTLNDYDVRQEALRIHTRMEAAREERERLEAEAREKREAEEKAKALLMLQRSEKGDKKKEKKGSQVDEQNMSQNWLIADQNSSRSIVFVAGDGFDRCSSELCPFDMVRTKPQLDCKNERKMCPLFESAVSREMNNVETESQALNAIGDESFKGSSQAVNIGVRNESLQSANKCSPSPLPTYGSMRPVQFKQEVNTILAKPPKHNLIPRSASEEGRETRHSSRRHSEKLTSKRSRDSSLNGETLSSSGYRARSVRFSPDLKFWSAEKWVGTMSRRRSHDSVTTNHQKKGLSVSFPLKKLENKYARKVEREGQSEQINNNCMDTNDNARDEDGGNGGEIGTHEEGGSDQLDVENAEDHRHDNENEAVDAEDGEDAPAGKGKNKGKASPKGAPQAKASKLSAAPSSTGSAITSENTPRFDPDKLSRDSPEYQAAVTSLIRQFKGHFRSLTIPCHVASGRTGNPGELKYSIHNTLYLEVHCPAVRPPVVVISDSGRRVVDFGDVSIGQTCPRSVTIQNISEKDMELSATLTNPTGPFLMLNALRTLPPGATHTLLLTFSPGQGQVFQEELGIKTFNSMLHLTLRGRGVNPLINLSVEDSLFDLSAVLVGEFVEKHFKVQNTSMLAIDYVIKQDSLSPLRHARAQGLPVFVKNGSTSQASINYVGTQNDSGKNVFDIVPTKGTIQAGETKEIMVTFAPDHESDLYSDGVRMELFDQEESHFFQIIGQAKPRVMFLEGVDPLHPTVESLALQPPPPEEDDADGGGMTLQRKKKDGKGLVVSPPVLVTIHSVATNDSFEPGVREIYAGCVRTMAVSQKKNGEFTVDGLQALVQKGFSVEPQKGMVEAGTKKPIVFTWTPPSGYDPSVTIEETAVLTLRCDVTEQITLMIRAMVVSE